MVPIRASDPHAPEATGQLTHTARRSLCGQSASARASPDLSSARRLLHSSSSSSGSAAVDTSSPMLPSN
ncbi:hypothetical protein MHYP_G00024190 [Metynnis hypsauchen]